MTNDLQELEDLNAASDALNNTIQWVEQALSRRYSGIIAEVPLRERKTLQFNKNLQNSVLWVLALDGSRTRLTSASRYVRIEAVRLLPALQAALVAARQNTLQAVVEADAFAQDFVKQLEQEAAKS